MFEYFKYFEIFEYFEYLKINKNLIMNYKMQIIKHFGPSILKVRIPDDILINLNNYIDKINIQNN